MLRVIVVAAITTVFVQAGDRRLVEVVQEADQQVKTMSTEPCDKVSVV